MEGVGIGLPAVGLAEAVCGEEGVQMRDACYARIPSRLWPKGSRKVKPTFAGPTVGSLRTNSESFHMEGAGIGLPAVGLAEAGGGGGIRKIPALDRLLE
jgi:hypothetical protein